MPTIISFRSVSRGAGASTLATTFAKETAKVKAKILFIEANLVSPSFASNTGFSNSTKNFLNLVNQGNSSYKITNYIATKEDVDKKTSSQLTGIDLLTIPKFQGKHDQVRLEDPSSWTEKFMTILKDLPYDYIVIDVPTELDEFTSYPILKQSDEVVSVVEGTPKSLLEFRNEKTWLLENNLSFKETLIINKYDKDHQSDIVNFTQEMDYLPIPYDSLRISKEWQLSIGSDLIDVKIQSLQAALGVHGVGYIEKPKTSIMNIFSFRK